MPFGRISEVYLLRDARPNHLGEVRERGLDCRIFGRLPSISSVQIDGAKIMVPSPSALVLIRGTRQDQPLR